MIYVLIPQRYLFTKKEATKCVKVSSLLYLFKTFVWGSAFAGMTN